MYIYVIFFTIRVSDPRIEHAYIQMGMARIEIDVYFFELFLLANQHPNRERQPYIGIQIYLVLLLRIVATQRPIILLNFCKFPSNFY